MRNSTTQKLMNSRECVPYVYLTARRSRMGSRMTVRLTRLSWSRQDHSRAAGASSSAAQHCEAQSFLFKSWFPVCPRPMIPCIPTLSKINRQPDFFPLRHIGEPPNRIISARDSKQTNMNLPTSLAWRVRVTLRFSHAHSSYAHKIICQMLI